VVVTTGSLPDGYVGAEEYVVVPSLRRARFLVPSRAPRAVASAFTAHLATVSARSRVYGRVIAAAFRYGLGERLLRDRLTVGIDARVPRLDWRHHLVMSELAHRLDAPGMVGIHPVRRFTPNAKPTVRLFDRRGAPLGYAKLGWSPPTRRLVRQEITALEAVDGRLGRMTVPHVLLSGRWSTPDNGLELEYVVTTALPPGLAPWRGTPESDADLLSAVAATGELQRATLAASRYSASLVDRLEASRKALPEETAALEGWLTTLQRRRQILDFGRWHGDWVAWNLASTASGGAVWDWEYSAPTVPAGFDLCHWYFQTRLAATDGNLDNAAAAIDQHAAGLRTLGVPPEAWDLVADLYLLEMLVRATSLAAEGSGWNSKLHPRLVSFARERAAGS
jgi:hypothetical protein